MSNRALHVCIGCRKAGSSEWFEHEHECPASAGPPNTGESWDDFKARGDVAKAAYQEAHGLTGNEVFDTGR